MLAYTPSGKRAEAWKRLLARTLDYLWFQVIVAGAVFVGVLAAPEFARLTDSVPSGLDTFVALFLWVWVESVLLWKWGRTPGKWLLGLRVETEQGGKPACGQALNRSLGVWVRGMALGIPVIQLLTCLDGYRRLTAKGVTSWDERQRTRVVSEPVRWWRVLLAVFLLMLPALLVLGFVVYTFLWFTIIP